MGFAGRVWVVIIMPVMPIIIISCCRQTHQPTPSSLLPVGGLSDFDPLLLLLLLLIFTIIKTTITTTTIRIIKIIIIIVDKTQRFRHIPPRIGISILDPAFDLVFFGAGDGRVEESS